MPCRRRDLLIGGAAAAGSACVPAQPGAAPEPERIRLAIGDQTHKPFVLPLLKLIGDAAGLQWELQLLPWPRALLGAELGQHLVFGLSRSPARDKRFSYSQPAFISRGWLAVPASRPITFERLEDLRGLALCTQRGASYGEAFEDGRRTLFRVESGGSDLESRARMLMAGRCDAMIATHRGSAAALERRLHRLRSGAQLRVLPRPLVEEGILFGAAQGSALAALLPRLDGAIHKSRAAIQALVDSDL
jgi:ABC-type amino acid transport substrate-binding protein